MSKAGSPGPGRPAGGNSAETERRLLATATELFATRGFFGVGIREIATTCGFTVASLYHYVGSKEELLERIMMRALLRFTGGARTAVRSSEDPVEQLAALVETSVCFHATNPLLARVVDKEIGALGREARSRVVALRDDYELCWTMVIENGIASGQLQVPHVGLARLALLGMCAEVAYWYSPHGPVSIAELRDHFVDMALSLAQADPDARPAPLLSDEDVDALCVDAPVAAAPTTDNEEGSR